MAQRGERLFRSKAQLARLAKERKTASVQQIAVRHKCSEPTIRRALIEWRKLVAKSVKPTKAKAKATKAKLGARKKTAARKVVQRKK